LTKIQPVNDARDLFEVVKDGFAATAVDDDHRPFVANAHLLSVFRARGQLLRQTVLRGEKPPHRFHPGWVCYLSFDHESPNPSHRFFIGRTRHKHKAELTCARITCRLSGRAGAKTWNERRIAILLRFGYSLDYFF
jgi:hypothetical protein